MEDRHQSNKRWWNISSSWWKKRREEEWMQCVTDPSLGFPRGSFALIRRFVKDLKNKKVCVLGSGDNFSSFVLASLGAKVTSVDISQEQLDTAAERAKILKLDIDFIQADATKCPTLHDNSFDFVCSTNGFYIWLADVKSLFSEVFRILKPSGFFMSYDIHPFQRPWKERNKVGILEMEKPYFDTTPLKSVYDRETGEFLDENLDLAENHSEKYDVVFEHHWTLSDIINPLLDTGLHLLQILEEPAEEDFFRWQEVYSETEVDINLLDWKMNVLVGLPAWLSIIAQK